MRNLGVPPTVNQLDTQYTTDFLKTVAERCSLYTGTVNPTVSQIPNKQWVLFKNITNGEVRLWCNDNGVLKNVLLSTNTTVPTFSAFRSTNQNLVSGTPTKILFDTVDFDNTSGYVPASGRWTPGVAGYYNISATVSLSYNTSPGSSNVIELYKNGSVFERGGQYNDISATIANPILNTRVQLSATDYVEVWMTVSASVNPTVNGAVAPNRFTHFEGALVSPL